MNKDNFIQPILIIIIAVLVIAAGFLLYNLSNKNAPAPSSFNKISNVNTAGNPFIGDENAPVTIAVWLDYQCPFCQKFEKEAMPQMISDYVNTGKLKIVFKDFQFLGQDSQTIGQFARAVWEAVPDKYGVWHKAMFDNQGAENSGWATNDKIMSITSDAIGSEDANKVDQLVKLKSAEYQKLMDDDKKEAGTFGINGTPGTIIGNQVISGAQPYSVFKSALDQLLNP
ncbi:MAG: thioredoxin domain-containing protein [Candidatus Staskawiczbacteria bacterium]|nr:thioredoxin domain-containing protein [Candidatus Staskawiczbacteria bacterium]